MTTLSEAIAAHFAADHAFNLVPAGAADWQFCQLESRAQAARQSAIEALQHQGIPRAIAERMLP